MLSNPKSNLIQSTQPNPITAHDLIQILLHFDPDLEILIPGYEGGFANIHGVKKENLLTNVNDEWYYGPHDHTDSVSDPENYEKKEFLILLK